jgi:uncharacterized damage-inducible protein DinB
MITLSTLTLLYDYHYWATDRMLTACERLTPDQWGRPLGHSWGSVHGMLAHMLAAEALWLSRWQGVSPTSLRQPEEFPALADVRREWSAVEANLRGFLRECDEARLNSELRYTTTKGAPQASPLGELMLHVVNHGTHHRGELAAMLALLGAPHPEDDLIFYLREKQRQ